MTTKVYTEVELLELPAKFEQMTRDFAQYRLDTESKRRDADYQIEQLSMRVGVLKEDGDKWQATAVDWRKSYLVLMRENDVLQEAFGKTVVERDELIQHLDCAEYFMLDGYEIEKNNIGQFRVGHETFARYETTVDTLSEAIAYVRAHPIDDDETPTQSQE